MEQGTATFIGLAGQGINRHWLWYVLGAIIVFFAFMMGQVPLLVTIEGKVAAGRVTAENAMDFYETADFSAVGMSSALGLLLLLVAFVVALLVLMLWVKFVHRREVRSLITSGSVSWRKVIVAFGLWFLLTSAGEAFIYLRDPGTYRWILDWSSWIPLMVVVLLVLPLQTTFEEVFVRGYLLQGSGRTTNRPWIAILLTSVFFGIMHVSNPEVAEFGITVMMVYYVSVGLFLAVITILDDGLEYALGIHLATNIYGAGFVSYEGSALQTDALIRVGEIAPIWMILILYVSMCVFFVFMKAKGGMQDPRVLFRPVKLAIQNTGADPSGHEIRNQQL